MPEPRERLAELGIEPLPAPKETPAKARTGAALEPSSGALRPCASTRTAPAP